MLFGTRRIGGSKNFHVPDEMVDKIKMPNLFNSPGPATPESSGNGDLTNFKPQTPHEATSYNQPGEPMTMPETGSERESPALFAGVDGSRPERHKTKWYDYVAGIGIPALLGGLSGQGAVQGALLGAGGMLQGRRANEEAANADYEKDRSFKQKDREIGATSALASAKLGVDSSQFEKNFGLKEKQFGVNKALAETKIGESATLKAAMDHVKKAKAEGRPPNPEALRVIENYQMTHKIDPLDYPDYMSGNDTLD